MGEKKPQNAMQAVLDRAGQQPPSPRPKPRAVASTETPPAPSADRPRFDRPSRRNTKLIGGHFSPDLARQMRMLAAEEDTTIQALLEEAIQLLLAKKARAPMKAVR